MNRADLRALTPETLAALANRGLVKRAEKDLAAGAGPAVTAADDGTVRGVFPDGVETVIAPGADLDAADCTCGAPGVCRHRIGLVLAYRQTAEDTPQESGAFADWSPGEFDDDALAAAVGRPALAAARRVQDRGYSARLHRPTPEDPVPRVELPTCTVTFPVPHELGYALTDAAPAMRGEVVVLAAWAFRAGDDAGRTELVTVGGRPQEGDPGESLRTALALAGELLLDGVQQAGPVFAGSLRQCREELTAASRHWPAGAVADLQEQVEAYATRGTRYDAGRYALLLAEIHARHRAAALDPVQVLGTKEAPTTPLRRVRLVALGCRIGGSAHERTAEVFFAHADAGIALVLRKRWDLAEGQDATGYELSSRRLLGSALHALAAANVVSEHTSRAADRTIAISRGRIAATSVTPVGSAWAELPGTLLLRDVAAHLRGLGERPPQLIRPRVAAESVRVVAVESVGPIGYDPAGQQLEAVLLDPAGNEVLVRAEHNPLCPGGLDALAAALGGGQVQCVSGVLGSAGGRFVLDPLAVLTPTGVVVPDLAAGEGDTLIATTAARPTDPITAALEAGLAALADAAHHGLRRLTAPARTRLDDSATLLRRTGLRTAAGHLRDLEAALRQDSGAVARWVDAHIHLAVSLETHRQTAA
ncbi:hypothetical protein [Actinacidiphila bryophytorum]|uniref:SWIM-type domain-containing protein n=1 Tax=Actinacidiphila bryophytorum TaxID=1436133 RepID=A0A9W4H5X0_9ACTN|nr:hypothetical protein [Actinacidiphila bryophytorum]CAG7654436.1 conserved hypothetical protein [Actinacidiphila bryophytorum]